MMLVKLVAIYLLCLVVIAGLVWLGGFDFDQRNLTVAFGAVASLVVAGLVTSIAVEFIND